MTSEEDRDVGRESVDAFDTLQANFNLAEKNMAFICSFLRIVSWLLGLIFQAQNPSNADRAVGPDFSIYVVGLVGCFRVPSL